MMKLLAGTLLVALAPAVFAANSLIRVDCMEGTAGAEVSINGKYQFTCAEFQKEPISLAAGDYTVTAVQPVSKEYERVFTQDISLKPGIPQRIRVVLPEKTLTEYGKAEEARQKEQARLAAEAERQRQLRDAVKKDMEDAQAGDPAAMQRLAGRYGRGDGVPQDTEKASQWSDRALAASEKQAREKRISDLKTELDNVSSFPRVKNYFERVELPPVSMASALPTALPVTSTDLTAMPAVAAKRKRIQEQLDELETHAVRWANPDSMVAQAYGGQHAAD